MKVKATEIFKTYRNASLKLPKADFRKLQAGKVVEIAKNKYDDHPNIYKQVGEADKKVGVKDGD